MNWSLAVIEFGNYLLLERGLSENTISAYQRDLKKANLYFTELQLKPTEVSLMQLQGFISEIGQSEIGARSQARLVSSLKAFYKYLMLEDLLSKNPADLLEAPKIGQKLPDFLSLSEIEKIINSVDLSSPQGHRNVAIFETLYSCGLRVSELIGLRLSDLFFAEDMIKVTGKGNKQRWVPINKYAQNKINLYTQHCRKQRPIAKGFEDFLFLNNRGQNLGRSMVFHITKTHALAAGISKTVSPHTFRHSFATHLVERGADLRAVQMLLGHESITTTEIYSHLDQSYLKQVLQDYHPKTH